MKKSEIAKMLRAKFSGAVVVTEGFFCYLHHSDSVFERRSVPCFDLRVDADPSNVVDFLRQNGFGAEFNIKHAGSVSVIDMPLQSEDYPQNKITNLGKWRYE